MTGKKKSLFERMYGSQARQPTSQRAAPKPTPQNPSTTNPPASDAASNQVTRPSAAPVGAEILAGRARRAVESLLENEALTEGLDDSAAGDILAWATERAQQVTSATAEMDDEQAEQATSEQMRSLRRMVRSAARWASAGELEAQVHLESLLEQAETALGSSLLKSQQAREALTRAGQDSAQRIAVLRKLIEGNPPQHLE